MISPTVSTRSEEHTSELQSQFHLVCRLLLEKRYQALEWRAKVRLKARDPSSSAFRALEAFPDFLPVFLPKPTCQALTFFLRKGRPRSLTLLPYRTLFR